MEILGLYEEYFFNQGNCHIGMSLTNHYKVAIEMVK
jgi:hypothetical protein